jgi:hypothetical protein
VIHISQNDPNENNPNNEPDRDNGFQDEHARQIAVAAKELQQYLELELGMAKFLDFQTEENYELIFQEKLYNSYSEQLFKRFFNFESTTLIEEARRRLLSETYINLGIENAILKIRQKSEEVSAQNGIKSNPREKMNKMRTILSMLRLLLRYPLNVFILFLTELSSEK